MKVESSDNVWKISVEEVRICKVERDRVSKQASSRDANRVRDKKSREENRERKKGRNKNRKNVRVNVTLWEMHDARKIYYMI